jgi:plastocyanin
MRKTFLFEIIFLILTIVLTFGERQQVGATEGVEFKVPEGRTECSPKLQQIKTGTEVKWINEDKRTHFLTAADPNRKEPARIVDELLIHHLLPPGDVFKMRFEKPGQYDFFCAIHMEMRGTVTVTP